MTTCSPEWEGNLACSLCLQGDGSLTQSLHLTVEEAEVQRGAVTCPRSHGNSVTFTLFLLYG